MGKLLDASKIARHPQVIDVMDAAVMSVALEVEVRTLPESDPGFVFLEEQKSLARRMISEIQGEVPRSYMTRLMWLVALDDTVLAAGLLAPNGTVDASKLSNDDAVLTIVRRLLLRMLPA